MAPHRRNPLVWGLASVLALFATTLAEAASFDVAQAPDWVLEMALPQDATLPKDDVRSGTHHLIADHQTRVAPGEKARYRRFAYRVLSTAGVQEVSEIKITFDPSYERLTIHHVRLWRGGRNVRTFRAADVKVIHEEADLSERIYNGSLSALVFLEDVRPDDVVDFAYTVAGANPILRGRFVAAYDLAYSIPVARLRHRLLWPADRALLVKSLQTDLQPLREEKGAQHVYTWERHDVPALRVDDAIPGWFNPYPVVQVSEFRTWNEVARWARQVFDEQRRTSPRLTALAEEWRGEPTEEARARRAIRFVQDEIRYLGVEMGPSSHRPHPPAQVLDQRFGDCKDKALLLTTLLGLLGIEAVPALVNTGARRSLDEWLPSPFSFDHAIVQARIAGATVWIDATESERGGPPSSLAPPPFERALLVRDDSEGLAVIPAAERKSPTVVVQETYTLTSYAAPAKLAVKTTYRGSDADEQRQSLARSSRAEVAERYLNHYARDDAGVRALAPPRFRDDRERNVIVSEEDYELPTFWRDHEHAFYAWAVGDELRRPRRPLRSMPFRLSHPVHVEHQLVVHFPDQAALRSHRDSVTSPGFSVEAHSEVAGRKLTLTYRYRSLGESLPAADTRGYLEAIERAEDAIGYSVDSRVARRGSPVEDRDSPAFGGLVVLGLALAGAGAMAVQAARARARMRAFRRPPPLPRGDSPATALALRDAGEVESARAARACSCGAGRALTEVARHGLSYDDQPMQVVSSRCEACGREQSLYFKLVPSA